jgi:hypothetical protein
LPISGHDYNLEQHHASGTTRKDRMDSARMPRTESAHCGNSKTTGEHMIQSGTSDRFAIRPVLLTDYAQWRSLWDGYNGFYGRRGPTALDERITA